MNRWLPRPAPRLRAIHQSRQNRELRGILLAWRKRCRVKATRRRFLKGETFREWKEWSQCVTSYFQSVSDRLRHSFQHAEVPLQFKWRLWTAECEEARYRRAQRPHPYWEALLWKQLDANASVTTGILRRLLRKRIPMALKRQLFQYWKDAVTDRRRRRSAATRRLRNIVLQKRAIEMNLLFT